MDLLLKGIFFNSESASLLPRLPGSCEVKLNIWARSDPIVFFLLYVSFYLEFTVSQCLMSIFVPVGNIVSIIVKYYIVLAWEPSFNPFNLEF